MTKLNTLLLVVSLLTFVFIIYKIRKSQLDISDSITWILWSVFIIFVPLVPSSLYIISARLGFSEPIIFLTIIFVFFLYITNFLHNLKLATLQEKVSELTQYIALKEYEKKN